MGTGKGDNLRAKLVQSDMCEEYKLIDKPIYVFYYYLQ